MMVLVGDIGATTCRLALARPGREELHRLESRADYRSSDYGGLGEVVARYLEEIEERPGRAAFGVAAPVRSGRARFANLPWEVSEEHLSRRIGIEDIRLLNDFEALCHAVPLLGDDDLVELLSGTPEGGTVAVLGAGTGLGHGFVTRSGQREEVHSSEAGHVDFAPRTPVQEALLRWLRDRYGRASCERVVSGPGLVDIYRFLVATDRAEEDPHTAARMEGEDPAAVISTLGMDGSDPACRRALDIFVSAYGAQAGNFALAVQATGGVFLGGGIAPKILPALRRERFSRAFLEKGKLASMMESIPVRAITETDAALLGAARAAVR